MKRNGASGILWTIEIRVNRTGRSDAIYLQRTTVISMYHCRTTLSWRLIAIRWKRTEIKRNGILATTTKSPGRNINRLPCNIILRFNILCLDVFKVFFFSLMCFICFGFTTFIYYLDTFKQTNCTFYISLRNIVHIFWFTLRIKITQTA